MNVAISRTSHRPAGTDVTTVRPMTIAAVSRASRKSVSSTGVALSHHMSICTTVARLPATTPATAATIKCDSVFMVVGNQIFVIFRRIGMCRVPELHSRSAHVST